eukprot:826588-Prymnesium_polylepis.1
MLVTLGTWYSDLWLCGDLAYSLARGGVATVAWLHCYSHSTLRCAPHFLRFAELLSTSAGAPPATPKA